MLQVVVNGRGLPSGKDIMYPRLIAVGPQTCASPKGPMLQGANQLQEDGQSRAPPEKRFPSRSMDLPALEEI
jgi:hypothetical protein